MTFWGIIASARTMEINLCSILNKHIITKIKHRIVKETSIKYINQQRKDTND